MCFQLHITATGYEACDGSSDHEPLNSTENNLTSTSRQSSHQSSSTNRYSSQDSTSNSTIFDAPESTICSDDFASSFPDVSIKIYKICNFYTSEIYFFLISKIFLPKIIFNSSFSLIERTRNENDRFNDIKSINLNFVRIWMLYIY